MPKLLSDRGPEHQPISWTMRGPDGRMVLKRIATLLAIGVLAAPLTIGVAALSGLDHRWPDILAQFTAPALAATALFTLVLLALRLRGAAIAALTVSAILAAALWPQAMPDAGKARPGAPVVTLYSANLHYRNTDTGRIRASITAADPDIIVLIETSAPVAARLDTVLAGYPHRQISANGVHKGKDATVIASRYPLTSSRPWDFSQNYMVTVVDSPLGRLNVVGAHLTRPWPFQIQWEQIRQATDLTDLMSGLSGTTIVAGDFNSISSGRIGRQIKSETGLKANPGWPGTWPAQLPAVLGMTIDQVWRTPDLAVVSRQIGQRNGSDHRPVVTHLTLAEPRPTS
ncbi:endonuclease/exonuclease/phosphatase family protein [Brevundimonas goettingensis]|uniref:Endonuclease/exonuclease/phosphatase family protein n=1 Tax=Brevundimonas goettingensis TaxID=2774190 RepID=A0A975GUG1_9CAUL|nr:endonuclease/exonuclease/phosphatase family protein [Brevundimonas goettingensis]QTC89996.1 endonuclease/exonuclease/phosphatase family protein [Brevundimonas goettingensis]